MLFRSEKLDYLKELGVTTILFTPLYESEFYHNYFPTDYEQIDPEYGTKEDYINFIKAVHSKGLKFLMDMETQYAQNGHIWFDDSYKNPSSEYSDFIYYSDSLNEYPEQIFFPAKSPLHNFKAWPEHETNSIEHNIPILNLNNEKVKQWMKDFYVYWVDPNKDGKFDDGVDGFRIDHIMDDLDYKGVITNMYTDFWKPIFSACKDLNPNVFIVGEQSNWADFGEEMVHKSGADAAFNFALKFAVASQDTIPDMYEKSSTKIIKFNAQKIHHAVQESLKRFGDSTFAISFIENHDTDRWASLVNGNKGQMEVAAVMNVLLPGIPSVYYGQELGLTGKARQDWGSDTNHIPIREAFPWTANYQDIGNALWYKETGPWWDLSVWQTPEIETLALSSQKPDSTSLWSHYQKLIGLKKSEKAFQSTSYSPLSTERPEIFGFKRTAQGETVSVLINITDAEVKLEESFKNAKVLYSNGETKTVNDTSLKPYGFLILKDSEN